MKLYSIVKFSVGMLFFGWSFAHGQYQYTSEQEDSLGELFSFYGDEALEGLLSPDTDEKRRHKQNQIRLGVIKWTNCLIEHEDAVVTHYYFYLAAEGSCSRVRWIWDRGGSSSPIVTEYLLQDGKVRVKVYETIQEEQKLLLKGGDAKLLETRSSLLAPWEADKFTEQEKLDLLLYQEIVAKAHAKIASEDLENQKSEQAVSPKSDRAGG